jgi:hypothetical protein
MAVSNRLKDLRLKGFFQALDVQRSQLPARLFLDIKAGASVDMPDTSKPQMNFRTIAVLMF